MSTLKCLIRIATVANIIVACTATNHVIGNSIWSIPVSDDFYANWSNNVSFLVGDTLGTNRYNPSSIDDTQINLPIDKVLIVAVFKFDTGLSDVTQVSRREYEDCTAENPFKKVLIGPATVSLDEEGMRYYICSFGNYCRLGQKIAVPVQRA